jgi:hypothetical protein
MQVFKFVLDDSLTLLIDMGFTAEILVFGFPTATWVTACAVDTAQNTAHNGKDGCTYQNTNKYLWVSSVKIVVICDAILVSGLADSEPRWVLVAIIV